MAAVVLVHGAGDTARVWRRVIEALDRPVVAVDLPGRGTRPADITAWTADGAAAEIAAELRERMTGDLVVVAHSAAGTVGLRLAAHLGPRVRHLVLVAGISAAPSQLPVEVVHPQRREEFEAARPGLFERYRGHTYLREGDPAPDGLLALTSPRAAQALDSMNLMFQPADWTGVAHGVGRTWVRCLDDAIQPREMQDRLIEAFDAHEVLELASGHTPARDAPVELAALIESIAARYDAAGGEPA